MKRLFTNIGFLTIAIIGIFGLTASAQASRLSAEEWHLTHLNGQPVGDTKAFIAINTDSLRFSGNAGCNRIFGTFSSLSVRRNAIRFTGIGSTRMACVDPNIMRLENEFIRTLEHVTSYQLDGRVLKLFNGRRILAQFKTDHKSDNNDYQNGRLDQKKWILDNVKGSPIPKVRETAFISFDSRKKSAGGNTSCNGFGGSYETKGSRLRIFEIIHTMRACIEDERMNVEGGMLQGLQDTNRYEIRGNRLYLYKGRKLLLEFHGEKK